MSLNKDPLSFIRTRQAQLLGSQTTGPKARVQYAVSVLLALSEEKGPLHAKSKRPSPSIRCPITKQ